MTKAQPRLSPAESEWADCFEFDSYSRATAWLTQSGYSPGGNHRSQSVATVFLRGEQVAVVIPTTARDVYGPVVVECDEAWELSG